MQDDSILVERRDRIAVVTVNRPESRNAMTMGMWEYVPELMKELGQDPAVASSVFVTMITDSMGFFAFLGLAVASGLVG